MRIAVIGPGAVGTMTAAYLRAAGHDVVLLARDAARAAALRRRGLRVDGVRGTVKVRVTVAHERGDEPVADRVVLAVKTYDTESAMRQHAAWVGPRTVVVTFQNGLGNVEAIGAVVGAGGVLAGTSTQGVTLLGPGRVRHAGAGDTFVGEPDGRISARARRTARVFRDAGIPCRAVADAPLRLWTKLAINAGINALTAILRVPNGRLIGIPDAARLMDAAAAETARVARRLGVPLEPAEAIARTRRTAERTAANRSSMLADVLAGRRTEIEAINGAVARFGRRARVPTPINDLLAALVRSIESAALSPAASAAYSSPR
jgi:2-dehydropantoate 2-reductase